MKKLIITFLCLLSLHSIVFAIESPEIQMIEKKGDMWSCYGTGLQEYDKLEYFYDNEKMQVIKYKGDDNAFLEDIDSITNGEFYIETSDNLENDVEKDKSSKIKIYKPIDIYINSITKSYSDGKYLITVNIANRTNENKNKLEVYIDDNLIDSENIDDQGNKLIIDYENFSDSNKINILIKDNDKYISNKTYDLGNNINGFAISHIERNDDIIKAYFYIRGSNSMKVFLDNNELTTDRYDFIGSYLYVYFDVNDSTKLEHSLYIQGGEKKTKTLYINLRKYIKPNISSFVMTKGNRTGYENHIIGDNLEGEWEDVSIKINGKKYGVKKQNYGYWHTKITNSYAGKTDDLVGDEKQKVIDAMDKELDELEDYMYGLEQNVNGIKFVFTQKMLYLTGSENTIQVIIGGEESNIFSFVAKDNREEQEYGGTSSEAEEDNNLLLEFTPSKVATGTNYSNKEFNIGKLSISMEGDKKEYNIDSISFDINLKKEHLPIQYIKLGTFVGYITQSGSDKSKYTVTFENIFLSSSKTYDLKIKLTDNYETFDMTLLPTIVDYFIVDESNNGEMYTKDITYESGFILQNNFVYIPCFDTDSSYANCKTLGYKDKTRYEWAIESTDDSVGVEEDEEPEEVEPEVYVLTDDDNAVISIFMDKIDSYVDNKAKGNEKSIKILYEKIHSLIEVFHSKLEEGRKKEIIGEIMNRMFSVIKKMA